MWSSVLSYGCTGVLRVTLRIGIQLKKEKIFYTVYDAAAGGFSFNLVHVTFNAVGALVSPLYVWKYEWI